jgi:signal transduction histidine kinase/ActR/RegA family two-component response regulator
MTQPNLEPGKARQALKQVLARLEVLPAPGAVAGRILTLALERDLDLRELARLIESEPSLALRVLKMAGSAAQTGAVARSGGVRTIDQALVVLGLQAVRGVAFSVAVRETLYAGLGQGEEAIRDLWRHSLAAACAAQLAAETAAPALAGAAFAAALVHDCGKLLMLSALPAEYPEILDEARRSGRELADLERAALGLDHTQAGKWLADKWSLPRGVAEAIWLHHLPPAAIQVAAEEPQLVLLAALGDAAARQVMVDRPAPGLDQTLAECAGALGLSGEAPAALLARVRAGLGARYAERAEVFDLESDPAAFYFAALQRANLRLADMSQASSAQSEALMRINRVLDTVSSFGPGLAAARDPEQVLAVLAEALGRGLGVQGVAVLGGAAAGRPAARASQAPTRPLDPEGNPAGLDPALAAVLADWAGGGPGLHSELSLSGGVCRAALRGAESALGEMAWLTGEAEPLPQELIGYRQLAKLAASALARIELVDRCQERAERLASAMRDIGAMNVKLMQSERLAAVGQLAAGAAHEINNPLAIVYARVQLMERREEDPKNKKGLRQIREQIERISSILTSLLDFARPAPPRFEAVDVNAVIERTLALISGGLAKRGIGVERRLAPGLPAIQADSRQLEQLFLNLFINAEHAMGSGGTLTLSTSAEPGGWVRASVRDTGAGIPPEHLARIFDPFFTTKEEGKGTGLGLSISYGIVSGHGGEIKAESEPGRFTEISVRLPADRSLAPAPPAAGTGDGKAPAAGRAERAVLVVDDEPHIRDILREALKAEGFAVATAENGEEALALLENRAFTLILLDIRMPRRDGLSFLRQARSRGRAEPVLVLTGMAGQDEVDEALALGAAGCVRKPFRIEELMARVRTLASGRDGP